MGARPGERVGVIYGEVESTEYRFAASDPDVKRLEYVMAEHPNGITLGQVLDVESRSRLSFEEAVSLGAHAEDAEAGQMSCHVKVIGMRDERGLLQVPRTPFRSGTEVRRATAEVVQKVLGLTTDADEGVYLGYLKGTEFPVVLDADLLVQKHVSVLAKTGAGKSYTVGVLIEELLKKRVPLVILDAHGEYGTLGRPNIEPNEIDNLVRFKLKPKSFAKHVTEYALDTNLVPGAKKLSLSGSGLEAPEILDLLGTKTSSAQQGLLYQAVNELKRVKPGYSLTDIMEEIGRNPSNAKWPLIASLENLDNTGLFHREGTTLPDLVQPGHASIVNLKGAPPQIQEIVVARLARGLFDARKREQVPPHLLVVEEAHNFAPERGTMKARSGPELRTIASEGRKFGMGLLVVSQRPAKVDKNVLSQCNTQIIMKVTNPNDVKAISQSVEGLTAEATQEIQRLGTGVCIVSGGRLATPIQCEVRTRQTRHGGKSVSVVVEPEDAEPDPAEDAPAPPEPVVTAIDEAGDVEYVDVNEAPEEELEAVFGRTREPEAPPSPDEEPEPASSFRHNHILREARRDLATKDSPWGPQLELPPERLVPATPRSEPEPLPSREPAPPKPEPRPLPEPEHRVAPNLEPDDLAMHRVISRVGYLSARTSREAVVRVKDVARQLPTLSPEDYVRAFARIGRTYCYPSLPECGPCPLLRTCRLGLRRLARGEVREGKWGRRAS